MLSTIEDDGQRESSPFISSDNDEEQDYEGKNMALFEVKQTFVSPVKTYYAHLLKQEYLLVKCEIYSICIGQIYCYIVRHE